MTVSKSFSILNDKLPAKGYATHSRFARNRGLRRNLSLLGINAPVRRLNPSTAGPIHRPDPPESPKYSGDCCDHRWTKSDI